MAYYGRFGQDGEFLEVLRNPTPIPPDAIELTKYELFVLMTSTPARLRRYSLNLFDPYGISEEDPWPTDSAIRAKVVDAQRWLAITERPAQQFIEEKLAIQMGSTEITSTTLPNAFGLKLFEFRDRLRKMLSKQVTPSDQVPVPPDD